MVQSSYMLAKPPPPSAAKRYFDQQVVPALINLAGACEGGLEQVATLTRRAPVSSVGTAFTAGILLACLIARRRD